MAKLKLKKEGVIHGDDYECYTVNDIQNITNYDFLERLSFNIITPGQPTSDFIIFIYFHPSELRRKRFHVFKLNYFINSS